MEVGRYAGVSVDQLPNSYLRWLVTQDFSKDIVECAIKKLKESNYDDLYLCVSRHAIDMYSQRFLSVWQSEAPEMGLASFIAKRAEEAWKSGKDVSKHRHQDDGIIKEWRGINWVFHINPNYPDYRDVITVMHSTNQ